MCGLVLRCSSSCTKDTLSSHSRPSFSTFVYRDQAAVKGLVRVRVEGQAVVDPVVFAQAEEHNVAGVDHGEAVAGDQPHARVLRYKSSSESDFSLMKLLWASQYQ